MKDIKCGLKTCTHNKGYCCCAKQINVSKGADCLTYSRDPEKNLSMFEAGSDFVKADYSVNTKVGCEADCVFNKSGKCEASGITVMCENNSNAGCLTFLKK